MPERRLAQCQVLGQPEGRTKGIQHRHPGAPDGYLDSPQAVRLLRHCLHGLAGLRRGAPRIIRRGNMLRFRNLALVLLAAFGIYALLPKSRKGRLSGKVREFGKALILSLILYWILIVSRAFFIE